MPSGYTMSFGAHVIARILKVAGAVSLYDPPNCFKLDLACLAEPVLVLVVVVPSRLLESLSEAQQHQQERV